VTFCISGTTVLVVEFCIGGCLFLCGREASFFSLCIFQCAAFSVLRVCFPIPKTIRNSPNLFYVMVVLAPQTSRKVVSLNIHYLTNSSIALTLQLVGNAFFVLLMQ